eukprot:3892950-Prymnesium_polylepis.1
MWRGTREVAARARLALAAVACAAATPRVSVLTFAHCLHTTTLSWAHTSLGQVFLFERANTSFGQVSEQGCANSKISGPTP